MLTEEDRALGKATQEAPEAMGRLKQKALDAGMGLKDYVLMLAGQEQADTQKSQQTARVDSELAELREHMAKTLEIVQAQAQTPAQQPIQPAIQQPTPVDAFGMIKSFFESMKAGKEYDNSVLDGYRTIKREVLEEIPDVDDVEPASAEDLMTKEFFSLIKNRVGGGQQPQAQQPIGTTVSTPVPVAANTTTTIEGEAKVMTDEQVKETVGKIPEFIQTAIKSGQISLEQAKVMVKSEAPKKGLTTPSDADIEKIYNEVKQNDEKRVPAPTQANGKGKAESGQGRK